MGGGGQGGNRGSGASSGGRGDQHRGPGTSGRPWLPTHGLNGLWQWTRGLLHRRGPDTGPATAPLTGTGTSTTGRRPSGRTSDETGVGGAQTPDASAPASPADTGTDAGGSAGPAGSGAGAVRTGDASADGPDASASAPLPAPYTTGHPAPLSGTAPAAPVADRNPGDKAAVPATGHASKEPPAPHPSVDNSAAGKAKFPDGGTPHPEPKHPAGVKEPPGAKPPHHEHQPGADSGFPGKTALWPHELPQQGHSPHEPSPGGSAPHASNAVAPDGTSGPDTGDADGADGPDGTGGPAPVGGAPPGGAGAGLASAVADSDSPDGVTGTAPGAEGAPPLVGISSPAAPDDTAPVPAGAEQGHTPPAAQLQTSGTGGEQQGQDAQDGYQPPGTDFGAVAFDFDGGLPDGPGADAGTDGGPPDGDAGGDGDGSFAFLPPPGTVV
jgi:hypothetical protein